MSERPVYDVEAVRHDGRKDWELTVRAVPGAISLVPRLAKAEEHIREAIAWVGKVDPDSFDLRLHVQLPGGLEKELHEARSLAVHAEQLHRESADRTRAAVKQLRAVEVSSSDIASILGVSQQRVSQLLA